MRTTLNIDDQLMGRVRRIAARRGVTLTQVFEDALREMLTNLEAPRTSTNFEMPVVAGRRLPRSTSLIETFSMNTWMDGGDSC